MQTKHQNKVKFNQVEKNQVEKRKTETFEAPDKTYDNIKIVAITGGIGSGKTTVGKHYESLGYPVIFTDDLSKRLLNENPELKTKLIASFGNSTYSEDGKLNSEYLSAEVFSEEKEKSKNLEKLNQIVHPYVIEEMMDEIEKLVEKGNKIIFVESALIYEAGLDEGFDYVIVVDSDEKKRIQRTAERLKLSEEKIRIRNREQISTTVKKNLADFVIENNGTMLETLSNAEFVLDLIKMA